MTRSFKSQCQLLHNVEQRRKKLHYFWSNQSGYISHHYSFKKINLWNCAIVKMYIQCDFAFTHQSLRSLVNTPFLFLDTKKWMSRKIWRKVSWPVTFVQILLQFEPNNISASLLLCLLFSITSSITLNMSLSLRPKKNISSNSCSLRSFCLGLLSSKLQAN